MFATFAVFAAEAKFNWGVSRMNDENIIAILESNDAKWNHLKGKVYFYQLAKKDPSILTNYDKFVSTMKECSQKYNTDADFDIAQLAANDAGVPDEVISKIYLETMKKDKRNKGRNYIERYYLNYFKRIKSVVNIDVLTDLSLDKIANDKINSPYNKGYIFNAIKKNQFEYSEENLKKHLKKLNRIVYPHIGENEEYKKLAVKIQLMLKSLE